MDSAPVMLWRGTADGRLTFANRAWLWYRGRTRATELGDGWLDAVISEDRPSVSRAVELACHQARSFEITHRVRRADGEIRWVSLNGAPIVEGDDTFKGHVGTCIDITETQTSAPNVPALTGLEALIGRARDMAYRLRLVPEPRLEYAAGAVEAITGYPPEAFVNDVDLVRRAMHPDDADLWLQGSGDPARMADSEIVIRWVHPDGKTIWAEHRRRPVFDATGRVIALEGIARDITGLVESQRQLKESEDQMRQLAARLQSAREEERAQVARELHDELGQTLTALKLEIGRAMAAISPHALAPVVIDRMQSLMGLAEIGIATVKRIATNLRPPALDHLGLVEAVRWEALAFKARSGLRCYVRTGMKTTRLTREQQTAVFRIFQEALTNVARHAAASAVTVTIDERRNAFELRIKDNGKGIAQREADNPYAIGLVGMRERAALVGGTFQISGRRGKGTMVSVDVPLETVPRARRPGRVPRTNPRIRR